MLFSNDAIAKLVQDRFEPVWESVRDVPMVTIDFGSGTKVKRTLHGNIATYVTDAEGRVLDVIPGLSTPDVYLERLTGGADLASTASGWPAAEWGRLLRDHHRKQLNVLSPPQKEAEDRTPDVRKRLVEAPLERTVAPPPEEKPDSSKWRFEKPVKDAAAAAMANDTRHNETVRMVRTHSILTGGGPYKVKDLTKRIYREVLDTDLDDPYLGLGETLFDDYPFVR